jgi:RNA polymerase sigma-70 factor (ECF subfamily)
MAADTRRLRGLDNEAIAGLYDAHARSILVFFTRRTFEPDVALELMAETFAQAVVSRRSFRGEGDDTAKAWLFAIARNQLAAFFKRGQIERRALARLDLEPPSLPDEELARVEELAGLGNLRTALREELARLGAEQRDAIALRIVDELPYPLVAERLGVSEQTARARVSRGLRALARALDAEGEAITT